MQFLTCVILLFGCARESCAHECRAWSTCTASTLGAGAVVWKRIRPGAQTSGTVGPVWLQLCSKFSLKSVTHEKTAFLKKEKLESELEILTGSISNRKYSQF